MPWVGPNKRDGGVLRSDIRKYLHNMKHDRFNELIRNSGVRVPKKGEPFTLEEARRIIVRFWFERGLKGR